MRTSNTAHPTNASADAAMNSQRARSGSRYPEGPSPANPRVGRDNADQRWRSFRCTPAHVEKGQRRPVHRREVIGPAAVDTQDHRSLQYQNRRDRPQHQRDHPTPVERRKKHSIDTARGNSPPRQTRLLGRVRHGRATSMSNSQRHNKSGLQRASRGSLIVGRQHMTRVRCRRDGCERVADQTSRHTGHDLTDFIRVFPIHGASSAPEAERWRYAGADRPGVQALFI